MDINNISNILFGGGLAFLTLIIIFGIMAIVVISMVADMLLFRKAGKAGWEAFVPFYNTWILVEISGLNWWWVLLIFATNIASFANEDLATVAGLISTFAIFNCYYNISKKFRKNTSISVLAGIFSLIFTFIFAFSSKEKYYKNEKVSGNGVFPDDNSNSVKEQNVKPVIGKYCTRCGCKVDESHKFCSVCGNKLD